MRVDITASPGNRRLWMALVGALAIGAAACESEITDPGDDDTEGQVTLDASSVSTYAYLSLANGGSVVTPADPSTSTEWHLAFRRYSAKLNGGVAGPGDVEGVNLENSANATEDEVRTFTRAYADAIWDAVTMVDVAGATFAEDGIVEDEGGVWFQFNPTTNTLIANPNSAWKVDESGTGHAVFRVSSMALMGDTALVSVTLQYRHQPSGGVLGTMGTIPVNVAGGPAHVSLETGAVVTPSGCNWDLQITSEFIIEVNTACAVGTFPIDSSEEDFATMTTAANAPQYGAFLAVLSGAFPSSISGGSSIFWYSTGNRLYPTFNVFLVRVGADVYKVQVLDYYSTSGQSGFPTVRFALLQ